MINHYWEISQKLLQLPYSYVFLKQKLVKYCTCAFEPWLYKMLLNHNKIIYADLFLIIASTIPAECKYLWVTSLLTLKWAYKMYNNSFLVKMQSRKCFHPNNIFSLGFGRQKVNETFLSC